MSEPNEKKGRGPRYTIHFDCTELDVAIEKANRLVELLREASAIIDSLSGQCVSSKKLANDIIRHLQE